MKRLRGWEKRSMAAVLVILVVVALALVIAMLWLLYRPLQSVVQMQVELRGLSERIGTMERGQGSVGHELMEARLKLTEMQTQARERYLMDQRVADSVRRLETIIAGTQSKGAAGENILEVVFAQLPPDWQERNFTVGNKTVEFALRLPNNRVLPIDSKWPATDLLEQFVASDEGVERQRLKRQIEATVLGKAREVRKYLDPNLTTDFGVAAVPDAVYDLCTAVQSDCFKQNVILVAYSMFVPYLLLVFQTILKSSQSVDLDKLDSCLGAVEESLRTIQDELQGRYARAITMLSNGRSDMSAHLDDINRSLAGVRVQTSRAQAIEEGRALPSRDGV